MIGGVTHHMLPHLPGILHLHVNRNLGTIRVHYLHVQTGCVAVIFKNLGLIRLSRILSYTNHESGKFQSFHV